jgi:hypothetical protein
MPFKEIHHHIHDSKGLISVDSSTKEDEDLQPQNMSFKLKEVDNNLRRL